MLSPRALHIEEVVVKTFGGGIIRLNIEVSMHFLRVKSDRRATSPPL